MIRLLRGRAPLEGGTATASRSGPRARKRPFLASNRGEGPARSDRREADGFDLVPREAFFKRLDPPTDPIPDTELPFETLNISNADPALLAARLDPTGSAAARG